MDKSLYEILFDGASLSLLTEIVLRTFIMFLLILTILRISGRRGVRQLTLFEVAIILGLGSAAGDPMFQDDIPILHALLVFITVILLYKLITWLAAHFDSVNKLLEGEPLVIVREGTFAVNDKNRGSFNKMEFFSELRNLSIEHLGQVKMAVLETDGTMSVLKYKNEEVRYGLPLFPGHYIAIDPQQKLEGPVACMFCGYVIDLLALDKNCPKCNKDRWALAINTVNS